MVVWTIDLQHYTKEDKMSTITWYDGVDNYKVNTLEINKETNRHSFTMELLDVETSNESLSNMLFDVLSARQTKTVDVLYSGGLDSELVIRACIEHGIPVRANTMNLKFKGASVNTHDLYYSIKFCSENSIQHNLIDLDIESFFESGDYLNYLTPYYISEFHVATHLWLLGQFDGFAVAGGDYSWPWLHKPGLSPHQLSYSSYCRYIEDNDIHGLGNTLNHKLDMNLLLMRSHLATYTSSSLDKSNMYSTLGLGTFEPRIRNYGWDRLPIEFERDRYSKQLVDIVGITKSTIKWNTKMGDVIGLPPGSNDKKF